MNTNEPNYEKYSMFELHQALGTIEKDKFPERTKKIEQFIEARKANPTDQDIADLEYIEKQRKNWKEGASTGFYALFFVIVGLLTGVLPFSTNGGLSYESNPHLFIGFFVFFLGAACYWFYVAKKKWDRSKNDK
jgi:hypothetical protein